MTDTPAEAEHTHPASVEELADTLSKASADDRKVLVWGGGTHQGFGYPVEADLIVSTDGLSRLIDWEPDDLTVVVESGTKVSDLESRLATRGQTAVLSEAGGEGTVGGAVAAGISGYRRARYGPTRDRILEVTLVTGDGRVVRAGGRVVKNVTGYDLPRLMVGSFGSLGVIVSVCLKLCPLPPVTATVTLDRSYHGEVYRPLAVLERNTGTAVYLGGTEEEVSAQIARLSGISTTGLDWPPAPGGEWSWSLRLPQSKSSEFVNAAPRGFVHQVGVGEVAFATPDTEGMEELRGRAEAAGGRLVVTRRPSGGEFEPWGKPPAGIGLQARLMAAFDPVRILNAGRLPGGI